MDWALVKWIARGILSPTRVWAEDRIKNGKLNNSAAVKAWNFQFRRIAGLLVATSIATYIVSFNIPSFLICIVGYLAFARTNELLIAFYKDAFDKIDDETARLPLSKSQRIKFLATSYLETIVLFGLMHLAMQTLPGCGYNKTFENAFDAIYFSTMTITTTGFGDIYPVGWPPRLLTMFESLTGIVYLALTLSAYMSMREPDLCSKDDSTNSEEKPSSGVAL